jgi:hypothetical protein
MAAIRMILIVSFMLASGIACGSVEGAHTARYKITNRFPDRLGQVEVLGIEVRSALPDGTLSDAELKKLAGFFCAYLQYTTIGLIANLNAGANAKHMAVILTVDIDRFDVTTPEQQRNKVPAYLFGSISLHRVSTDRQLGSASVWARGSVLDLSTNYPSDTVDEFALAIRQIVQ